MPSNNVQRLLVGMGVLVGFVCLLLWAQRVQRVGAMSYYGRSGYAGNPAVNSGSDCTTCHTPGESIPEVEIRGPTAVQAGSKHIYTVKVSGGPGIVAGMNASISPNVGVLAPLFNETHLVGSEIAHTEPKRFHQGTAEFAFEWTVPENNQTVTLYVAGNSANNDGNLTGDGTNTASITINIAGGADGPAPTPSPTPSAGSGGVDATFSLEPLVTTLQYPVHVTHAGDERLFVVDLPGWIWIVDENGDLRSEKFLDIFPLVTGGGESGMPGLAFHPNYKENGQFFVAYTTGYDDNFALRVSRFNVSADPNLADVNSKTDIIDIPQPGNTHNGGTIGFGKDGYLYIATGDGGGQGDPDNRSQNKTQLQGKMIRIDVDKRAPNAADCGVNAEYTIPADNMFNDGVGGNCDEVYAMGLRNPWKWSFDRATGDIWIGDVGQRDWEEVNFIAAGSSPTDNNFGWRCYEGNHNHAPEGCPPISTFKAPLYEYAHGDACSITGGYVYRGTAYPDLIGNYLFADFCDSKLRVLSSLPDQIAPQVSIHTLTGAPIANAVAFGEDVNGELLMMGYDIEGEDSGIYRLRYTPDTPANNVPTAVTIRNRSRNRDRSFSIAITITIAITMFVIVTENRYNAQNFNGKRG